MTEAQLQYFPVFFVILVVLFYGVVQTIREELRRREYEAVEEDIPVILKVKADREGNLICPACGGENSIKILEKFTSYHCKWCGVKLEVQL